MVKLPSDISLVNFSRYDAASSRTAKPRGHDVTIVKVRLPVAYAGAAKVVAAAAVPPIADVFKNERRSISYPPR